jgi:hypothetical protein
VMCQHRGHLAELVIQIHTRSSSVPFVYAVLV